MAVERAALERTNALNREEEQGQRTKSGQTDFRAEISAVQEQSKSQSHFPWSLSWRHRIDRSATSRRKCRDCDGAPCGLSFVDTLLKCSAGQSPVTVAVAQLGSKTLVHDVLGHAVVSCFMPKLNQLTAQCGTETSLCCDNQTGRLLVYHPQLSSIPPVKCVV